MHFMILTDKNEIEGIEAYLDRLPQSEFREEVFRLMGKCFEVQKFLEFQLYGDRQVE